MCEVLCSKNYSTPTEWALKIIPVKDAAVVKGCGIMQRGPPFLILGLNQTGINTLKSADQRSMLL
jgi:hypothetical protein